MSDFIRECVEKLKGRKNVVGFSKNLKPRIRNGKEVDGTKVIRVYVSKKESLGKLKEKDVVPGIMCGGETDVVEVGDVKALSIDRTARFRPVELNISIGNITISSGSLGMIYKVKDGNAFGLFPGEIVLGSNAHVLCYDSSKEPSDVVEKRIAQPGVYHQPIWLNNLVGNYLWHQVIYPSEYISGCRTSKVVTCLLNKISKFLRRRTIFKAVVADRTNYIDFALYSPTTEHLPKVSGDYIKPVDKFVGHLFAGSDIVGVMFGVDKILPLGVEPMLPYTVKRLKVGSKVKGVSFWGEYETIVIDDSAIITVSYGNFNAVFEDVILLSNNGTIKGGWSGSSFFLKG